MRPFQYGGTKDRELFCDRVPLARLVREYGTPLYVYSANNILDRVRMFVDAFKGVRATLCYSVKANPNLSILQMLANTGAGFDIVSGGELERVRQAAKSSLRKVVFSGVGKTAAEMDAALAAQILVFNVESPAELDLLEQRARHLRKRAPVAMRVNPDVFAATHPYISTGMTAHKFGVAIADASELYERAARSSYLIPTGVSVHIGSQIRVTEPFGQALQRVMELVRDLQSFHGIRIQHIDAGGGLGISYDDPRVTGKDRQDALSFDPMSAVRGYAQHIRTALTGFEGELLLEPGRFIVAQAGALLATVLYTKHNGPKTFVVTDAAMNDLLRPALYQAYHSIVPLRRQEKRSSVVVDVVGPICETGDFFARDRELPAVDSGECIALLDAGAYGMSLSSNYNSRPRAAEVLVEGNRHRLTRRRETMRELLLTERSLL
ncbi:MAG TPA: diaminopimelate decarboxylase [Acidobacteriaceae bacterium]|nr:diaminopimelate decarboxylase [Acidobacteriaceae bacterium]